MERKLAAYQKKAERFEQAEGMDTEAFIMSFNKGELGDNKKWLKWDHIANVANLLKKKLGDLESLATNVKRDTFGHFCFTKISQSSKR